MLWRSLGEHMRTEEPFDLIGYEEASILVGLPLGTLYSLVSRRRIPHIRLSDRIVRFSEMDLREWIESGRRPLRSDRSLRGSK